MKKENAFMRMFSELKLNLLHLTLSSSLFFELIFDLLGQLMCHALTLKSYIRSVDGLALYC